MVLKPLKPWEDHTTKYLAEKKIKDEELAKRVKYEPGPNSESP